MPDDPPEPTYRTVARSAGVTADSARVIDNAYRAFGRYHYEFSRVVFHMRLFARQRRDLLIHANAVDPQDEALMSALVDRTAGVAGRMFFDRCRAVRVHDSEDSVISAALQSEFERFTSIRNDLSHGDLVIGWGNVDGIVPPMSMRMAPTNNTISRRAEYEGDLDLDVLADQLAYHKRRVGHYAQVCLTSEFFGDLFGAPSEELTIRNGRVELMRPHPPERDMQILP